MITTKKSIRLTVRLVLCLALVFSLCYFGAVSASATEEHTEHTYEYGFEINGMYEKCRITLWLACTEPTCGERRDIATVKAESSAIVQANCVTEGVYEYTADFSDPLILEQLEGCVLNTDSAPEGYVWEEGIFSFVDYMSFTEGLLHDWSDGSCTLCSANISEFLAFDDKNGNGELDSYEWVATDSYTLFMSDGNWILLADTATDWGVGKKDLSVTVDLNGHKLTTDKTTFQWEGYSVVLKDSLGGGLIDGGFTVGEGASVTVDGAKVSGKVSAIYTANKLEIKSGTDISDIVFSRLRIDIYLPAEVDLNEVNYESDGVDESVIYIGDAPFGYDADSGGLVCLGGHELSIESPVCGEISVCSVCGFTVVGEHDFEAATCTAAGYCKNGCGATGEAKLHHWGNEVCDTCGDVIVAVVDGYSYTDYTEAFADAAAGGFGVHSLVGTDEELTVPEGIEFYALEFDFGHVESYGIIYGGKFEQLENHGAFEYGTAEVLINHGTVTTALCTTLENYGRIFSGEFTAVTNTGEIYGGNFNGAVENSGTIYGGYFYDTVENSSCIYGGVFNCNISCSSGAYIENLAGGEYSFYLYEGKEIVGEYECLCDNHYGGEATCTEYAYCALCKEAWGDAPSGHSYDSCLDAECEAGCIRVPMRVHSYTDHNDTTCNNEGCTTVRMPHGEGAYIFDGATGMLTVNTPEGESVWRGVVDPELITAITFGGGVERASGEYADIPNLKKVVFLGDVEIASGVLIGCDNIEELEFYGDANFSSGSIEGLTKLTSLYFRGESTFDSNVFSSCTGLISVTFAAHASVIGANAFSGCTSLEKLSFESSADISNGAFSGALGISELTFGGYVNIGEGIFSGLDSLTSLEFPSASQVGMGSFDNCNSLESAAFGGESVIVSAFRGCGELQSLSFESAAYIEGGAFVGCYNISELSFGGELIGTEELFCGIKIESLVINQGSLLFGQSFNNCSLLKSVTIGAEAIGTTSSAFNSCPKLESVTVTHPTAVGPFAFVGCNALKEVSFKSNATIETGAFSQMASLEKLSFEGDARIGVAAFCDSENIKSIKFGAYTSIQSDAFPELTSLTELEFLGDAFIEADVFVGATELTSLTFSCLAEIGERSFCGAGKLTELTFEGIATIADGAYGGCSEITSITFGDTVSIGEEAFLHLAKLTELSFEKSAEIGRLSFANCGMLEGFSVGTSLKLGAFAFSDAASLSEITVGEELNLTMGAFAMNVASELEYDPSGIVRIRLLEPIRDISSGSLAVFSDSVEIIIDCENEDGYIAVLQSDATNSRYIDNLLLVHEMTEATCAFPRHCTVCLYQEGEALGHELGAWETVLEPTRTETGVKRKACSRCDYSEEEAIPALGGLSGGAIAAIASGSAVAASAGGFSVFWFLVKKRSFAELIGAIKRLFSILFKKNGV